MKTSLFAPLLAIATTILASPLINSEHAAVEARADESFTYSTDVNFGGRLEVVKNPGRAVCVNFAGAFDNSISSARPTSGIVCAIYTDKNCGGDNKLLDSPGIPDLGTINFDNVASSYKCWYYE